MIENGHKTSLLIPSQLPEFVRDDPSYANFVLFLQAYYQWMEETGQVTDRSKNLLNYTDIDKTLTEFLDYFYDEFLVYFPQDILADKVKVAKMAKQLYQSKGTQASYKFLFRTLYNSDVEFFYTKDAVLKASAGKWYVAKSLKLDSTDLNFLQLAKTNGSYRLFGETTKSIATVETAIVSGSKIEVFISDIQRLFQSGEFVRVVDANNQDILFNGQPLSAKIVGQIGQVLISPNNRGLLYRPGDPVIVYNGLTSNTGLGATATVGETTSGSIQRVTVTSGGYGFRENPNTQITLTNAPGAYVTVSGLNPSANGIANATFVPTDVISVKQYITIGNTNYNFSNLATANANTSLANAFTFTGFTTYPISSVLVENSGGGITSDPTIQADSLYTVEDSTQANLRNLGILAPIQITTAGTGYSNNQIIQLNGGSGYGANAKISKVSSNNGSILEVQYTQLAGVLKYPLGGLGYRADALPSTNIVSSGANAVLTVPGILGDGAVFSSIVDRVGSITTINIIDAGEDYVSTPNVSLKVQDMVVSNVAISNSPSSGDIIYQGTSLANSSYKSVVDSIEVLVPNGDPTQSLWRLRVYNYNAIPNYSLPLKIDSKNISVQMTNQYSSINTATRFDSTGLITYGDGTAQASATFLNGLVVSQGQYLDTTGQPSSFDVLQNEIYNNYTYEITLEKEIASYRETLMNLLHPSGMKVIGRYAMKSNADLNFTATSALEEGQPLSYYTGHDDSYVTMNSNWTNQSNNIMNFSTLHGANLESFIFSNSNILLTLNNGFEIHSDVSGIIQDDKVVLTDNVWLTYANVAYVTANSGGDVINITSLTGSYNIVNNGTYSNTAYPLKDIVYAGDKILVANNTEKTVDSVDYVNGTITLTEVLANTVNSLMSVQRTVLANNVIIYGTVGLQYNSEIVTQNNETLLAQSGAIILIG